MPVIQGLIPAFGSAMGNHSRTIEISNSEKSSSGILVTRLNETTYSINFSENFGKQTIQLLDVSGKKIQDFEVNIEANNGSDALIVETQKFKLEFSKSITREINNLVKIFNGNKLVVKEVGQGMGPESLEQLLKLPISEDL